MISKKRWETYRLMNLSGGQFRMQHNNELNTRTKHRNAYFTVF